MNGVADIVHSPSLFKPLAALRQLAPVPSIMALLLILSAVLAGCASKQIPPGSKQNGLDLAIITRDILYAMAQIYEPDKTTVQLGKPTSAFGLELESGFRKIGYGIQRVEADHGPFFMTYTESTSVPSGSRSQYKFTVFVGDVGLERDYVEIEDLGVAPSGPMSIYGTTKNILLNDQLFPGESLDVAYRGGLPTPAGDEFITVFDASAVPVLGDAASVTTETNSTTDANIMSATKPHRAPSSGSSSTVKREKLPSYKSFNSKQREVQNLFLRGSSNFSSLNSHYRVVRKEVIAFPNDSLFLLTKGRSQISRIIKLYRPNTDVIRVVGCSNGPTEYKGGNEALAIGRSARIAQELVSRSVDKNSILDEGCWAGESAGDRFPDRGVVVELQRKS